MKNELNFSEVPIQYTICFNRQCPKAETCLRQLAEISMPDSVACCSCISPRYIASLTEDCPYYRSARKIRYAKGFMGILDQLPHKQMREIIDCLIHYFGRRTYYRTRKGERPMPPAEQQNVLNVLKRHGAEGPFEFDSYYDSYAW